MVKKSNRKSLMNKKTTSPALLVQPGLGTTHTKPGGELRSLWIEIPGWCDLFCPYCFAGTRKVDLNPDNLTLEEYYLLLKEFASMGGKHIAIPGKGEPFYRDSGLGADNRKITLEILHYCQEFDICLTIFTTGHWLDEELIKKMEDYNVVFLIKFNSSFPEIQNDLVGMCKEDKRFYDYADLRDKALMQLMKHGYNTPRFGKTTRLGIVTSVMTRNFEELPQLLRFARNNNLIFDCDTILEHGRGKIFVQEGGVPPDDQMKKIFEQLQKIDAEEFSNHWSISRSYIGTCCDRFRSHLYVSSAGDVHPCVGATSIQLGNLRSASLADCWDNPVMKIIRNRCYEGKCSRCANFKEEKCHSCLGRCTTDLTESQILNDRCVTTTGCWNFRKE